MNFKMRRMHNFLKHAKENNPLAKLNSKAYPNALKAGDAVNEKIKPKTREIAYQTKSTFALKKLFIIFIVHY